MPKLIPILILLSLACQGVINNSSNRNIASDSVSIYKNNEIKVSKEQSNVRPPNIEDSSLFCKIDTIELKTFWTEFITSLKIKNKQVISESLNFDFGLFLGTLITYPNFMKNCDTFLLGRSNDFYGISKLTKDNFDQYFDTVFNENFIELVSNIKIDEIMKNGQNTGYSYVYSYKPNLKDFPCSHEKVVIINLFYCSKLELTIQVCC